MQSIADEVRDERKVLEISYMCTQKFTQSMICPFVVDLVTTLSVTGDLTVRWIFLLTDLVLQGWSIRSVMLSVSLFPGASLELMVCLQLRRESVAACSHPSALCWKIQKPMVWSQHKKLH